MRIFHIKERNQSPWHTAIRISSAALRRLHGLVSIPHWDAISFLLSSVVRPLSVRYVYGTATASLMRACKAILLCFIVVWADNDDRLFVPIWHRLAWFGTQRSDAVACYTTRSDSRHGPRSPNKDGYRQYGSVQSSYLSKSPLARLFYYLRHATDRIRFPYLFVNCNCFVINQFRSFLRML